jgi:hypothetical protein
MILYACFLKSGKKAVLFFSAISLLQSFLRLLIGLKLCLRPKQYLIYTKRSTVGRPVMTHLVYQPGTAWFEYRIIVFCHNRQISRHLVILMKHEHSVSIVAFLLLAVFGRLYQLLFHRATLASLVALLAWQLHVPLTVDVPVAVPVPAIFTLSH